MSAVLPRVAPAAPPAPGAGHPIRVLFLTQYFPPETGAAPARAHHFAQSLARAGHEVRVLTGLPNHPAGEVHAAYRSVRRATERAGAVQVERVWLHATPQRTLFTRLWNHLSFALAALPVALAGPRPDVVLASTPPLFLGITAWLAAVRHRAPLVLDVRDDWPRAAIALGELKPGPGAAALGLVAGFLQRHAARVVAVTPGMRRQLEARGLDAGRIELIMNGADTELFTPGEPPAGPPRRFTVLYAGTHGLVHGMETLLEAAVKLRGEGDLRFVFVGDGVAKPALERRASELGLANVEFRSSEPPEQLVATIRSADLCVATTLRHEFSGETVPVKLFDYFACGRAVVAAVSGDAADLVTRSGAAVRVEPGDAEALAAAIVALRADPARCALLAAAGPAFVAAHHSRRAAGLALEHLLSEVVARARGRRVEPRPRGFYSSVRRACDVTVAVGLGVLLAPLLGLAAIAIRADSTGPALFRQRRVGRGSAEFTIVKFRTMAVGTPDVASHLRGPASTRITRVGRFLRRTSIDELPQLWNVLTGEMTLIGPRPALFNQQDLIAQRQAAGVDALKPGVTGWAQVHGRDEIPIPAKVELDRHYLDHVSPRLDLEILLRTVGVLFSDRGTN